MPEQTSELFTIPVANFNEMENSHTMVTAVHQVSDKSWRDLWEIRKKLGPVPEFKDYRAMRANPKLGFAEQVPHELLMQPLLAITRNEQGNIVGGVLSARSIGYFAGHVVGVRILEGYADPEAHNPKKTPPESPDDTPTASGFVLAGLAYSLRCYRRSQFLKATVSHRNPADAMLLRAIEIMHRPEPTTKPLEDVREVKIRVGQAIAWIEQLPGAPHAIGPETAIDPETGLPKQIVIPVAKSQ